MRTVVRIEDVGKNSFFGGKSGKTLFFKEQVETAVMPPKQTKRANLKGLWETVQQAKRPISD